MLVPYKGTRKVFNAVHLKIAQIASLTLVRIIWLLILNRLAYHAGTVKVRDVLKLLRRDGWSLVTTVGSYRQLKHPTKPGRVTVSGHPSDDIHPKTLKSILTQAGLKK